MAIESAVYVQDLDANGPPATDFVSEGDDHLRLLKAVLKTTFPDATSAVYVQPATQDEAEAGVVENKVMNPLNVRQAIDVQRPYASTLEAQIGLDEVKMMTPALTRAAVLQILSDLGLTS